MREFLDYGYDSGRWFCFEGSREQVRRIIRWLARYDVPCEYTEDYGFVRIHCDDVDYVEELVS